MEFKVSKKSRLHKLVQHIYSQILVEMLTSDEITRH